MPQTRNKCSNLSFQESVFSSCHFSQAFEDRYFRNLEFFSKSESHPWFTQLFRRCFWRALKEVANGWRGIGPYLAEKRRTIYNRQPANVRTITGHDEIVEKDRGSKSFDHRRGNGDRNGGIRDRAQSREETGNEDYQISETLNVRLQVRVSKRIMAVSI